MVIGWRPVSQWSAVSRVECSRVQRSGVTVRVRWVAEVGDAASLTSDRVPVSRLCLRSPAQPAESGQWIQSLQITSSSHQCQCSRLPRPALRVSGREGQADRRGCQRLCLCARLTARQPAPLKPQPASLVTATCGWTQPILSPMSDLAARDVPSVTAPRWIIVPSLCRTGSAASH